MYTGNSFVLFRVFSASENYYWNQVKLSSQVNFERQNVFLLVNCKFFNNFRDLNFLKWKQLYRIVETKFFNKSFIRLVETDFLSSFLIRANFVLVEAIIGVRRGQFSKEELLFLKDNWFSGKWKPLFSLFFTDSWHWCLKKILHSGQWKQILQQIMVSTTRKKSFK